MVYNLLKKQIEIAGDIFCNVTFIDVTSPLYYRIIQNKRQTFEHFCVLITIIRQL